MLSRIIHISMAALIAGLLILSCKSDDATTKTTDEKILALASEPDPAELAVAQEPVTLDGPLKISSYGPRGESRGQVQIRIDFNNPIIPLTTLSDEERAEILSHFQLEPAVEGAFRMLGTTSVVFEPKSSLWMSTDYRVVVKKGLSDIGGSELEEDFDWTFQTPLPRLSIWPSNNQDHVELNAAITVRSSVALNMESLRSKLSFYEVDSQKPITFKLLPHDNNPDPDTDVGPAPGYLYVCAESECANGTQYPSCG